MRDMVSLCTIHATLREEKNRQNNVSRPRPGAPRKLAEEDRDQIHCRTLEDPMSYMKTCLLRLIMRSKRSQSDAY